MVILICTRNTELNTYKAGGGRRECTGIRLSLRSAPMTGGRTAQARIFRSTDAEAHKDWHTLDRKKENSRAALASRRQLVSSSRCRSGSELVCP
jgi:hypothetical protein